MRTARVRVNAEAVSPSKALALLARTVARDGGPLVVVTSCALSDLAAELGDYDRAARRLLTIATNTGCPICVNLPTPEGATTVFIAPKDWSQERLAGWAAGHHLELAAAFGPVAAARKLEEL